MLSSERFKLSSEMIKTKDFLEHRLSQKSYSGHRPSVTGLNVKFERSVETAPLSGGPLVLE